MSGFFAHALLWHLKGDFGKFWSGQTISTLGSSVTSFALPLLVFKLTNSPLNLALTMVFTVLPYLMEVLNENKEVVPGYRTLTVIGVTPSRRGILYQKVLSSEEPGFISEPAEVQTMLSTVSEALVELKAGKQITWVLDSGFDDVAVWHTSLRTAGAYRVPGHSSRPPRAVADASLGSGPAIPWRRLRSEGNCWLLCVPRWKYSGASRPIPRSKQIAGGNLGLHVGDSPITARCVTQVGGQITSEAVDSGSCKC
jgi:hypothetical protein